MTVKMPWQIPGGVEDHAPMVSYPGERELYEKFSGIFTQYLATSDRASALISANKVGDAMDC